MWGPTPTITALTSTLGDCGATWSPLKGEEEAASPDNLLLDSLTFQTTSPYHMAPWPHTNSFYFPAPQIGLVVSVSIYHPHEDGLWPVSC